MSKYFVQSNLMHQGEKLRKYLKSKDYSQKKLLEMTIFSKSKLYGLYKQSELSQDDREQIVKDFNLEANFFSETQEIILKGESAEFWQKKYYDLLEKYNSCLEEKDALSKKFKSEVVLSDKHVSK